MAADGPTELDDVVAQLRMLNAILASFVQKEHEVSQSEMIAILGATGAKAQEIGRVLGTTLNTVQVTQSRMRKRETRTK